MQVSLVKIISYSISFTFSFDVRIRSRDSSRILRKQSALCQLFFRVGIPIWDVRAVLTEREGSLSFLRAVAICGVWRVCFEGAYLVCHLAGGSFRSFFHYRAHVIPLMYFCTLLLGVLTIPHNPKQY